MQPAIRVENLGKRYRLTTGGARSRYRTFREALVETAMAPVRRLRGGRRVAVPVEEFWALKDVSFEVQPGEVVGIIGRNGAGKSTLLKILSRITKPTTGRVELNGRVGSLLEVGTGFHPELTGRENVYLNGSILGMSRQEIDRKFDEIVAFAEVEKFLDLPVKRYSSGMYVRLAFAVAAHLEPEILIVDEVLAVGDAGFQQKCLGKMRECASDGRTVLLVSHQMNSVRDLCDQAVWLDRGSIRMVGAVSGVLERYLGETAQHAYPGAWADLSRATRIGHGAARFSSVRYHGASLHAAPTPDGPFQLTVRIGAWILGTGGDIRIEFQLLDRFQTRLLVANTLDYQRPLQLREGQSELTFEVDQLHLAPGMYSVNLLMGDTSDLYDAVSDAIRVEVVPSSEGSTVSWNPRSLVTCAFSYRHGPVDE